MVILLNINQTNKKGYSHFCYEEILSVTGVLEQEESDVVNGQFSSSLLGPHRVIFAHFKMQYTLLLLLYWSVNSKLNSSSIIYAMVTIHSMDTGSLLFF